MFRAREPHLYSLGARLRRFARLPSRVLAVAGAMVLGAIGTVALASPASATGSPISYEVKCDSKPYTAKVTWTVKNGLDKDAVVYEINRTLDGIAEGTTVPANGSVAGTEVVDLTEHTKIELKVRLKWGHYKVWFDKTADLSKVDCKPKPTAEFTDKCDGTTVVKVTNPEGAKKARFAVNGKGEFNAHKDLDGGESWEVTVPAANAEHVRVKVNGETFADHKWKSPADCYTVSHKSTCDKLTITVTNTGVVPLTATAKVGDEEADTEIAPGASDSIEFQGTAGLVVTLIVNDKTSEIKYVKPSDCEPLLPVTGVNAGLLAGAAFVLLSGGAGLFFMARRRRIRFAA
jgi:hypothetical protein